MDQSTRDLVLVVLEVLIYSESETCFLALQVLFSIWFWLVWPEVLLRF